MFEQLKQRLKSAEEGSVPCMYLDTLGYVTVGVGHLLASSQDAAALPFVSVLSGLAVGADAIRAEYAAVLELEKGRLPDYYRARTRLRLTPASIDALLDADVELMYRGLGALLSGLDSMPEPAQDALLDMAFQLGPHGLVGKFPGLMSAVKRGDWAACAALCHGVNIAESRNQIRARLFQQAAAA